MHRLQTQTRIHSIYHRPEKRNKLHTQLINEFDTSPMVFEAVVVGRVGEVGGVGGGQQLRQEAVGVGEDEGAEYGEEGEEGEGEFGEGEVEIV